MFWSAVGVAQSQLVCACRIGELGGLLQHREQVLAVVEEEADEIATKFGSERRTVMSREASTAMSVEDIIPNSQSLVVYSRKGYIKRIPADTFAVQNRGGKGGPASELKWPQFLWKHVSTAAPALCSFLDSYTSVLGPAINTSTMATKIRIIGFPTYTCYVATCAAFMHSWPTKPHGHLY